MFRARRRIRRRTLVVGAAAGAAGYAVGRRGGQPSAEPVPAPPTQAAVAPPSVSEEPDYVAELEKLAQLKKQGILTPEEFETKKKQILGI